MELSIQERLKDLRVERGLTLEQLAEQTHLSKSALGSYEGDMLQKIELMPNIAWVRVALHDDTEIVENNGTEELVLAGDTIVICTTILPTELEKLVNCEWLCSDGVITIKASELNTYSCVPPIPENFDCLEIVWD